MRGTKRSKDPVLHLSVCLIGLLLLTFALPGLGQPWTYEDMTALTNGGIPESLYNDMSGFSFQNNQYVYYVAQLNSVEE
jgi:hypothetical protein